MKRSTLVLGLASLALSLSACSGKAKTDDGKDVAAADSSDKKGQKAAPNPWASDSIIEAAEAEKEAKTKKKKKKKAEPAPAATAAASKPNPWSTQEVIDAAEAEKEAKSKKKKKKKK